MRQQAPTWLHAMKKLLLLLFIFTAINAQAHGGRLNSTGCHNQNSNGTYHCHQGQLAGQNFSSRQEAESAAGQFNTPPQTSIMYRREDYLSSWKDADRDCINTRHEVLLATSLEIATMSINGCNVVKGKWLDPYTNNLFTDPKDLDIDHVVPLAEAHRSGASKWSREKKQRFANDINNSGFLLAVDKSANRSKGDKDPASWMPPNDGYHCQYIKLWVSIKSEYDLNKDQKEIDAINGILEKRCK
jgi:hypothetical protein